MLEQPTINCTMQVGHHYFLNHLYLFGRAAISPPASHPGSGNLLLVPDQHPLVWGLRGAGKKWGGCHLCSTRYYSSNPLSLISPHKPSSISCLFLNHIHSATNTCIGYLSNLLPTELQHYWPNHYPCLYWVPDQLWGNPPHLINVTVQEKFLPA